MVRKQLDVMLSRMVKGWAPAFSLLHALGVGAEHTESVDAGKGRMQMRLDEKADKI